VQLLVTEQYIDSIMHGATIKVFSPTCFGRQIHPSSGALFDCIYSFWYNARHCCRPVPRLRWNVSSISTVALVGSSIVHCTKICVWSQKVLLRMGEFVARNV